MLKIYIVTTIVLFNLAPPSLCPYEIFVVFLMGVAVAVFLSVSVVRLIAWLVDHEVI